MPYQSTKTFTHDVGLSACFRQWRANSHCNQVHGYALAIHITFGAKHLDDRNWVVDFGGMKDLKQTFQDLFDHKTLVARDDPHLDFFLHGQRVGVMDVVVVDNVGCEAFAQLAYETTAAWLVTQGLHKRCHVVSVEVREHGANSGIYLRE